MADSQAQDGESFEVVDTLEVLAEEYRLIWGEDAPTSVGDYHQKVQAHKQAALCLSGGGIRSASFALGVMQALSQKGLLTRFQYLSTVSGGGYIGGWLQRWIHEEGTAAVDKALHDSCDKVIDESGPGVAPALTGKSPVEPPQIQALRRNSNFITPRVGLGSNDTWTAISISVRNIAVNWLLFAPLFVLVAMIPNLVANLTDWIGENGGQHPAFMYLLFGLAMFCAAMAAWHTCRALPSYRKRVPDVSGAGDDWLLTRIVVWLIGWAMLGTIVLWPYVEQGIALAHPLAGKTVIGAGSGAGLQTLAASGLNPVTVAVKQHDFASFQALAFSTIGFTLISFFFGLGALIVAGLTLPKNPKKENPEEDDYRVAFRRDIGVWVVAFVIAASTIPIGCWTFELLPTGAVNRWSLCLFATLGPVWLMFAQLTVAFVFAAFRRDWKPPVEADSDREWLARLSAVKIKPMLLWAVLGFTSLLLFPLIREYFSTWDLSVSGIIAALSGTTAIYGGKASRSGNTTQVSAAPLLRRLPMRYIVSLATAIFVIVLLTWFAAVEATVSGWLGETLKTWVDPILLDTPQPGTPAAGRSLPFNAELAAHVAIGVLLGLLLWQFSKRIPVNRFSLNGLYRNRLSRAFLGGARPNRKPDPFTGFDPDDNIGLAKLRPEMAGQKGDGPAVLYPVINVALNVTASENLAWQERKAASFILTPLYCGSAVLSPEPALAERAPFATPAEPEAVGGGTPTAPAVLQASDAKQDDTVEAPGVYVSSVSYGGSEPELIQMGKGISLATAISISGAAASPNMGYHSSPATALLMTLFNVRLGAWLPNPARAASLGEKVYRSNPSNSLRALLRELGGQTDDQGSDIYLSDGGHFENLAVYEMIRRRCPFILVSDAGADPNCDFEDLGNLVRKAKIDLGADIAFGPMRISSRSRPIDAQLAWAMGTISYGNRQTGKILYIKPSFFGRDLPLDVVSYAAGSATFPHESTGDQFFSESQFESYRKLGFTLTRQLGGNGPFASIEAFFEAVNDTSDGEDDGDRKLKSRFLTWLRGFTPSESSPPSS